MFFDENKKEREKYYSIEFYKLNLIFNFIISKAERPIFRLTHK